MKRRLTLKRAKHNHRKRCLWLWLLLPAIVGATACRPQHEEMVISFAYQDRVADAASIIAVRKGYFGDESLAVQAQRFSSGPACSEALYTGAADVATMGDTTAVIAIARGVRVRILTSHGGGEHRHRIMVGAGSGISGPAELAGRRVAVKKGTSTYGGFLELLDRYGIEPTTVEMVDLRPVDMPEALASRSVEAIVASEPTPSLCEAAGATELTTLGSLGSTYPILLMAGDSFAATEPDRISRMIRALERATELIHNHPAEAAAIVADETGLSLETAARAMNFHSYGVGYSTSTAESLTKTARFLFKQQLISRVPDFDRVIDVTDEGV